MTRPVSDPWQERLSDYVDGDLDPSTRAAVEAHLLTCAECREIRGALERVVARARRAPNRPPATDLWGPIEARIAAERDRRLPVGRRRRVVTLTMGRLAAAAAIVALVAGGF